MISRAQMLALIGAASLAPTIALGSTDVATVHDPSVLQAELKWLRDTMIEVGAKPFAYCDREQWEAQYNAAMAALDRPMSMYEYWLHVGPVFAALNDGHASVSIFAAFVAARNAGEKLFPLLAELRPTGMFVTRQTVDGVPAETQLTKINGLSAADLTREVMPLIGGQHEALRYDFSHNYIALYMYGRYRNAQSFAIEGVGPTGEAVHVVAPTMSKGEMAAKLGVARSARPNYAFSRIAENKIGYIDYRSCEDMTAFEAFLKSTFTSIQDQPIRGLVIDIRNNLGGNSDLNDRLWQYISGKPFAQFGRSLTKVSDRLKKEYGREKYVMIYGQNAWEAVDGTVLQNEADGLVRPGPNPLRYSGPVYLLIGTSTFSSALACAVAAKDFSLATIVGSETAEPVNSTGEVYSGQTPSTGLSYFFTTKFFLGPKPRPDGQGVVPDVAITPTEDDIRKGRDPVMDYAVKKILG